MAPSITIPTVLPILPLPLKQILFPLQVLSIQLQSPHSIQLIQSILKDAQQQHGPKHLIIGTAPLITPEDQLIPSSSKPSKDQLFQFGTAARLLRLQRLPSGGFSLVLEGLDRIKLNFDQFNPASMPFHETTVTLLPSVPLQSSDSPDSLLSQLQERSRTVLSLLESTSPLPALLRRRLLNLIHTAQPTTAPELVDSLMASIPAIKSTALQFEDKLTLLSLHDGTERVNKALEVLARMESELKAKVQQQQKGAVALNGVQGRRQREMVLLQQLQAIRRELEELAKKEGSSIKIAPSSSSSRRRGEDQGKKQEGEEEEDEEEEQEQDELKEVEKAVKAKDWGTNDEVKKVVLRELKRLKKSPPQGAEHGVIRNYLDVLLSLPFSSPSLGGGGAALSRDFIDRARRQLDEDHYGLEKVKKRLLEWLAVMRLRGDLIAEAIQEQEQEKMISQREREGKTRDEQTPAASSEMVLHDSAAPSSSPSPSPSPSAPHPPSPSPSPPRRERAPILLLSGPPGTGKTSIARSLASALGRKFYRISLGGIRDEAEIRGHRRTYVSALPGAIVGALKATGVADPVILLDEIDKLGMSSTHGDPGAALLEVLDPEQNWCFKDHYLDVPIDLSSVLFIATANSLDTISDPLYDRMEVIELSGYVHSEKQHIARRYLLPKQLLANSLTPSLVHLSDEALMHLITSYTHEAGVRSLERELGAVCRAKAVEYAEAKDRAQDKLSSGGGENKVDEEAVKREGYQVEVTPEDVERYLGVPKFDREELEQENVVGVSTGLAYQGSGNGGVLHIESTTLPGHGSLHLTGQLGDVISESAHLAFAWVKSHAFELGIAQTKEEDPFDKIDVHLHLPSGSIRKDGPSAGVAMVVAIVSLMRGMPQLKGVAMTGEITLRGLVTPVGGIKEKVLGAHRAGIHTLLLPLKNRKDVSADLPATIKEECTFIYTRTIWDALEAAFGRDRLWEGRGESRTGAAVEESRL